MTQQVLTREHLAMIVYRAELDSGSVHVHYTGRGMSRSEDCLGIAGQPQDLVRFVDAAASVLDHDHFTELFANTSSDALGRDRIYYWRSVQVENYPDPTDPGVRLEYADEWDGGSFDSNDWDRSDDEVTV